MTGSEHPLIRILVVDDHQMFIDGIILLLKKIKNIQIVAQAHDGHEALERLANIEIDMVITDISMPGMNGVELTRRIKQKYPEVKVLVLTMYNDTETVFEIMNTEAEGYILKNTGKSELLNAINHIAGNGTFYSHEIMRILSEKSNSKGTVLSSIDLTTRELEVLKLICEEHTSAEIADKLFISIHTVDTHRKHICQKIGTSTILGMVRFAVEHKLF